MEKVNLVYVQLEKLRFKLTMSTHKHMVYIYFFYANVALNEYTYRLLFCKVHKVVLHCQMQNSFWLARRVLLTFFLVRWYGYSWGIRVILRIKAPENAFNLQPSQQEQRCLEERYAPLPSELDYWNNGPEESDAFPGVSLWAKEKTRRQPCPAGRDYTQLSIFSLPLFSPRPDFLLVSLLSLIVFGCSCLVCQSFLCVRQWTQRPRLALVVTGCLHSFTPLNSPARKILTELIN